MRQPLRSAPRTGRYLNVILTVNAGLLSVLAYMQLAGGSPWSSTAAAQTPPKGEQGIPNAGAQRERIIDELVGLRASVDGLKKQFDTGKMKVVITNVDEFKAATKPAATDDGKGK